MKTRKKSDSDAMTETYDVIHALSDFKQIWSPLEVGYYTIQFAVFHI